MNTILLQKRIEEAATFLFKQRGLDKESCRQAMYYILANQWISIEEALPPEDNNTKYTGHSIRVFVRVDFNGQISYCNLVYIYEQNKWSMYDGHITHWMAIPELK